MGLALSLFVALAACTGETAPPAKKAAPAAASRTKAAASAAASRRPSAGGDATARSPAAGRVKKAPADGGASKDVAAAPSTRKTPALHRAPPPADVLAAVRRRLEAHVKAYAFRDPDNAWAIAHGLLALGPKMSEKERLKWARKILAKASTRVVSGRTIPVVEGQAPDGTPLEPHEDLLLRSLLTVGVPLDLEFRAGGRRYTVRDLYEGALWKFEPPHGGSWGAKAWTLLAIERALSMGEGDGTFVNHRGQRLDARAMVRQAAADLHERMRFLEETRDSGRPLVKRRQGIYAEPCGGFHFVQAIAAWGDEVPQLRGEISWETDLLHYRLAAERGVYAAAYQSAPPSLHLLLTIQELKFYGHWLETLADLRDAGAKVDPGHVALALEGLVGAVRRLEAAGAFDRMEEIDRRRHQSYLDLIGDSAHALRGLDAWRPDLKAAHPSQP
ncbi:MAG: hypothetical protein D6729_03730 [Deltaproteobacteria bacterium]|nr:MAG: hypothetical protein D6729_03730 [Deltaproteobacteria bacterium]